MSFVKDVSTSFAIATSDGGMRTVTRLWLTLVSVVHIHFCSNFFYNFWVVCTFVDDYYAISEIFDKKKDNTSRHLVCFNKIVS
jgi:hypothetical protein